MRLRRLASGSIVVVDVMEGSPAELAGIRPGDALASIGGEKVDSLDDLAKTIANQQEGSVVDFGVVRADKLGKFQVKMLPCEYKPTGAAAPAAAAPAGGATVEELSAQVRALQAQVDELSEAVRTLSAELREKQNP
jgi:C-terminal processing protease CtpA/Prc